MPDLPAVLLVCLVLAGARGALIDTSFAPHNQIKNVSCATSSTAAGPLGKLQVPLRVEELARSIMTKQNELGQCSVQAVSLVWMIAFGLRRSSVAGLWQSCHGKHRFGAINKRKRFVCHPRTLAI